MLEVLVCVVERRDVGEGRVSGRDCERVRVRVDLLPQL